MFHQKRLLHQYLKAKPCVVLCVTRLLCCVEVGWLLPLWINKYNEEQVRCTNFFSFGVEKREKAASLGCQNRIPCMNLCGGEQAVCLVGEKGHMV